MHVSSSCASSSGASDLKEVSRDGTNGDVLTEPGIGVHPFVSLLEDLHHSRHRLHSSSLFDFLHVSWDSFLVTAHERTEAICLLSGVLPEVLTSRSSA